MKYLRILNLSPESFSDGNNINLDTSYTLAKAHEFLMQANTWVDIGAASTKPNVDELDEAIEIARLENFLNKFDAALGTLSLDSYKDSVIKFVFENYSQYFAFLNDVSGACSKKRMALIADYLPENIKIISMHSKGGVPPRIKSRDISDDFYSDEGGLELGCKCFWEGVLNLADSYGVARERFVLDFGLGFGKNPKQSMQVLDLISNIKQYFGLEILLGPSRKSFLGEVAEDLGVSIDSSWKPSAISDILTEAYNQRAIEAGVDYLRVH